MDFLQGWGGGGFPGSSPPGMIGLKLVCVKHVNTNLYLIETFNFEDLPDRCDSM